MKLKMNVTSHWLATLRLRHAYLVQGYFYSEGQVHLPAEQGPALHHVQQGSCFVEFADQSFTLNEGDILLMRQGLERVVSTSTHVTKQYQLADLVGDAINAGTAHQFSIGQPHNTPIQILGAAACVHDMQAPIFSALPPITILKHSEQPQRLNMQLEHLIFEASQHTMHSPPLVARIAEIVFFLVIRELLQNHQPSTPLGMAVWDKRLNKSLFAIHTQLEQNWSVSQLAKHAGMSRSSFAALFSQTLNMSPMQYLAKERMRRATLMLREHATVQETALAVGYQSSTAFSTAFKRILGYPPSQILTEAKHKNALNQNK